MNTIIEDLELTTVKVFYYSLVAKGIIGHVHSLVKAIIMSDKLAYSPTPMLYVRKINGRWHI
jgi:hypothetical protein